MKPFLEAQTVGPLIVLGVFTASEMSVRLLDTYPSFAFAWYLNLEVFRPFQIARGEITPLCLLTGPNALIVQLSLIAMVVLARLARFRLGVAFLANLSFAIVIALTYAWLCGASHSRTASLVATGIRHISSATLVGVLLVTSFAAFLMSHVTFIREIHRSFQAHFGTSSLKWLDRTVDRSSQ